MRVAAVLLCVAGIANAFLIPGHGLNLDSIVREANKLLKCHVTGHKSECRDCCQATSWVTSAEKYVCTKLCYVLPQHAGPATRGRLVHRITITFLAVGNKRITITLQAVGNKKSPLHCKL